MSISHAGDDEGEAEDSMRWVQPSLFRRPKRTTVRFFSLFGSPYKRLDVVPGGTRQATRKFSGDSWFRKQGAAKRRGRL